MYLIVFRNRKRADIDAEAYGVEAARMEDLAAQQPGFLSFKGYVAEDGEGVAISEWASEEAARGWGRVAEHLAAQAHGRESYYAEYTLFAGEPQRIHRFPA